MLYALRVGTAPLGGDALEFHLGANLLADGHGYVDPFAWARGQVRPTADKPPLYEATLAALSVVGLRSPSAHHASGIASGVLLVPVVAALAQRVTGRRAVALTAAGLCAVTPALVMADGSLRSESLFALLVACALLAAARYRDAPSARRAAVAGAAVALAALTRGEGLLLAALLPLAVGRRGQGRHLAVGLAVTVAVLAPWLVRTWARLDAPVLISTNTGGLLAGANCDETYRPGPFYGEWSFRCLGDVSRLGEAEASTQLRDQGLRYARDHAGRLPRVLAVRAARTVEVFHPYDQADQAAFFEGRDPRVARLGVHVFHLAVLLALLALVLRAVPAWGARLLLAPALVVAVLVVSAYGWTRLRAGAEPGLVVLAAAGLVAVADRARARLASTPG